MKNKAFQNLQDNEALQIIKTNTLAKEGWKVPPIELVEKPTKTVVALDRNFHVYIHGGSENIERGYDEGKKKKFIKLYYNEEK